MGRSDGAAISTFLHFQASKLTLNAVLYFATKHRLLSFSPYKGDVENGISTGFQVTDKVLP
jgi:hypothetical protein